MKKYYFSLILLFLILPISCNNPSVNKGSFKDESIVFFNNLRSKSESFKKENKIKGMAIALFTNDSVIWKESFGTSTYSFKINSATLFSLQSVSKNFTALAVLMAVRDGLLDLDKPIIEYLPDFKVKSCFEKDPEKKITLRLLLSHTAGFTHEASVGNSYDLTFKTYSDHLESIKNSWLKSLVGSEYSYSNLGFDLAAQVIEKVSGMRFCEYLDKNIFGPLQMLSSTADDSKFNNNDNRTEGTIAYVQTKHYPIPLIGSGAVYSNVDDLIKYVMFHLNFGKSGQSTLIDKELLSKMYLINKNNYGLGTYINKDNDSYYFNHNGGGLGYGSSILWFPEYKTGCVVLGNKPANYYSLASAIIKEYILKEGLTGKKDTVFTKRLNPFINVLTGNFTGSHKINILLKDSVYKSDWEKYCGKYKTITGGMDLKWYAKFGKKLGFYSSEVIVFNTGSELWMKGSFGKSKLRQYLPGLFFNDSGEALDLRYNPATFRNIALKSRR